MAVNNFLENRKKVQKFYLESDFLMPLSAKDIPYAIYENKNRNTANTLKVAILDHLPVSENETNTFVLDTELTGKIFSFPAGYATVEKVFFIFTCSSLYVVLVEMKTQLQGYKTGIAELRKKMIDSMNRISIFLTHYIFEQEKFDNYPVKYFTLVLFNNENINQAILEDPALKNNDLVKIFLQNKGKLFNDEPLSRTFTDVIFKKNVDNSETFNVDLNEVFADDTDYENAVYSDKTFP